MTQTQIQFSRQDILNGMQDGDEIGYCTECGEDFQPIAADAKGCRCPNCGRNTVNGAEVMLELIAALQDEEDVLDLPAAELDEDEDANGEDDEDGSDDLPDFDPDDDDFDDDDDSSDVAADDDSVDLDEDADGEDE